MDHTERQVVCISQDSFYRDLMPSEKLKAEKGQYNFDHPDAFDNDLILQTLEDILAGIKCEIPAYDYRTNSLWVFLVDKCSIEKNLSENWFFVRDKMQCQSPRWN